VFGQSNLDATAWCGALEARPAVRRDPTTAPISSRRRFAPSLGAVLDVARRADPSCRKRILDECWRPAFARYLYPRLTGLRRELDTYLRFYNNDRVHHGRLTRGQIPADIVYRARKMETR